MRRQPSLRSQLNQIRLWVRQGRTDAWIAHKLDVSIDQLARFKQDHDLSEGGSAPARPADPLSVPPPEPEADEEPDADEEPEEPEAPEEPEPEVEEREVARPRSRPARRARPVADVDEAADEPAEADGDGGDDEGRPGAARRSRRRGRRGGRGRRGRPNSYEATFDHGDDGYGVWLDPAVVDNPLYAEHWAGHRAIKVTLDRDAITIRRAGETEGQSPSGAPDSPDEDGA